MFAEGNRNDLLPQVAFAPVVLCPRATQILFDDASVTIIGIALKSTERIYSDKSSICEQCRNRSACKEQMGRMKNIEGAGRPLRERTPISMAEANCMRM